MHDQSASLFSRAQAVIPGGVNSPVRAFSSVGGTPRFIASAQGAYMYDADGQSFIDCVGSWGTAILGHAHPEVIAAVHAAVDKGCSFGAPCALEVEMAELLVAMIPWLEQVRMVNSGTEATMSAIRLARGVTGRSLIIKFAGCYHGHVDSLLIDAGSGGLTFGRPSSAGVTSGTVADTLVLPYNDPEALQAAFATHADIAAVIVEPIAGNMNFVPANPQWLQQTRRLCTSCGALLIFDEVMSGFRVAVGGAAAHYTIEPDLVCYGKIIGGGMPVGAIGGSRSVLKALAPEGPVYQAGTLSGNPVALACGKATLQQLQAQPHLYQDIEARIGQVLSAWQDSAARVDIAMCWRACGAMFGFYFAPTPPHNVDQVQACDRETFNRFFHHMLAAGVYLAPSAFEAGFFSLAHDQTVVENLIRAGERVFTELGS